MTADILHAIPPDTWGDGSLDAANFAECELSQTLNPEQLSGLEAALQHDKDTRL